MVQLYFKANVLTYKYFTPHSSHAYFIVDSFFYVVSRAIRAVSILLLPIGSNKAIDFSLGQELVSN